MYFCKKRLEFLLFINITNRQYTKNLKKVCEFKYNASYLQPSLQYRKVKKINFSNFLNTYLKSCI